MEGVPGSEPLPRVSPPGRRWGVWILAPAVLGVIVGGTAAVVPWGRDLLAISLGISGLAWVLRIASDWFAERLGPQRGVAFLGSILVGGWLVFAMASPTPLPGLNFQRFWQAPPTADPYTLPPAGSRMAPDPNNPLGALGAAIPPVDQQEAEPPPRQTPAPLPPPAGADRGASATSLRTSSAQTVAGEGVILVAVVQGDGRPVRGEITFLVDDREVSRQPLRVQGQTSQTEFRLVGLAPGLHAIRATYAGSRTFAGSQSEPVPHRVVAR
jgi:hypothetical protein